MNPKREEYITAIFKLIARTGEATNKGISAWLEISPASVSEMTQKLKNEGLLIIDKLSIRLTEEGRLLAEKILSKHRLWELFLHKVLRYDWQDVHETARLLQSVTDDRLMDALNTHLNFPPYCPHGGIIFINDKGEAKEMHPLSKAEKGAHFVIKRINDNKELLCYVERKGLLLGKCGQMLWVDDFDETVYIRMDGEEIAVSKKAAEQIFVLEDECQ